MFRRMSVPMGVCQSRLCFFNHYLFPCICSSFVRIAPLSYFVSSYRSHRLATYPWTFEVLDRPVKFIHLVVVHWQFRHTSMTPSPSLYGLLQGSNMSRVYLRRISSRRQCGGGVSRSMGVTSHPSILKKRTPIPINRSVPGAFQRRGLEAVSRSLQ